MPDVIDHFPWALAHALGVDPDEAGIEAPARAERRRLLEDVRRSTALAESLLERTARHDVDAEERWRLEKLRHRTEAHGRDVMHLAAEAGASEAALGRAVQAGIADAERRGFRG